AVGRQVEPAAEDDAGREGRGVDLGPGGEGGLEQALGDDGPDLGQGEEDVVVAGDEDDLVAVGQDAPQGGDEHRVVVEHGADGRDSVLGGAGQVVEDALALHDP